ncbi:MAG: DNA topoisomerase IV [Flavobacteriaceae bacterium]
MAHCISILKPKRIRRKFFVLLCMGAFMTACQQPERNCQDFKHGKFRFTALVNGEEQTTIFIRQDTLEVDFYNNKADSSRIRWINDCEYIVKKLNPRNRAEEKSVHIKILTTTDSSYTFEYNLVGASKKSKGTAIKTH